MKTQMIKFLEENIGANFCDFSIGNSILDMALKSQATKENIYNLGLLKIKNLCFKYNHLKNWKESNKVSIKELIRGFYQQCVNTYNSIMKR